MNLTAFFSPLHLFACHAVLTLMLICLPPICQSEDEPSSDSLTPAEAHLERIGTTEGLGWNGLGIRSDGRILFVNEWGKNPKGLYLDCGESDGFRVCPFSVSSVFTDPEHVVEAEDGYFVTNNGGSSSLFFVRKNGGVPLTFPAGHSVDPREMFEFGSLMHSRSRRAARWIINPYGILVVPAGFDGERVSPGDLIVFDNAHGRRDHSVIWAIDPRTGESEVLAKAGALPGTFLLGTFTQAGALYAALNPDSQSGMAIVRVESSGDTKIVLDNFHAIPNEEPGRQDQQIGLAAHPRSGDLYFSIHGDVYAAKTTDYLPREVAKGGFTVQQWSADGRYLYVQRVEDEISLWRLAMPALGSD